jgi:hypothetical protein
MEDNFDAGETWGWYMWDNPWAGIYGQSVEKIVEQLVALRLRVSTAPTAEFSNHIEFEIPGWGAGIRSTCESWLLWIDSEIESINNCLSLTEAEKSIEDCFVAWADDFTSTGLFTFEPLATIFRLNERIANCVQLGPNVLATYNVDEQLDTDLQVWAVSESDIDIKTFITNWASDQGVNIKKPFKDNLDLPDGTCLVIFEK